MGERGRAAVRFIPALVLSAGLTLLVFGQTPNKQEPSVDRISRFKILTGEGRLSAGLLKVKLRQDQRFTSSSTYFVSVVMIDSSTATLPDSVRQFTIKNLAPNAFTIRSARFAADTVLIRWCAIGE